MSRLRTLPAGAAYLALFACSAWGPYPAWAQGGTPSDSPQDPVFVGGTSLVVLHVTVADKDDQLITTLSEEDFRILEDGEPQKIRLFQQEDVPVSVGILVDNSGSMRDKRRRVNTAAVEFVKASNPEDEVFIVNFNDDAYLDSDFTNDVDRLQDALQRIDSRGGTALYDAIQMSMDHVRKKAKRDKRVLLAITDGEDNASRAQLENLVRELQEQDSQTIVYAIGLLSEEEKGSAKRAKRAIRYVTRATGGPSYFPSTVDEVSELTARIAIDIRNQYTLTYSPPEGGAPGYREIKIALRGKAKKYNVRHRPGYFSE